MPINCLDPWSAQLELNLAWAPSEEGLQSSSERPHVKDIISSRGISLDLFGSDVVFQCSVSFDRSVFSESGLGMSQPLMCVKISTKPPQIRLLDTTKDKQRV